ncbi:type IX secretion system protein PorD [Flavitalea antarctica]
MRRLVVILMLPVMLFSNRLLSQELSARITINASQVSSQTDKKIFQTLQNSLTTFVNNRKWSNETFKTNEKIVCNFLVIINEAVGNNVYKASLTVQAARPVYNTAYETPLINFQDESFTFKYVEYQPIEFNENRVTGSDPLASNLSATIAYYAYTILGLDYNSFALRGGDPFFLKAQQIVNNAPEGRDINGWKAFDGLRNRYWLNENLTNNRYAIVHDAFYSYYRLGMDLLYENEAAGRTGILNTIGQFNTLNNDIPNTMIVQFFFQGKATELIRIFKKGTPEEKQKAQEMLVKLDIANSNRYRQELR